MAENPLVARTHSQMFSRKRKVENPLVVSVNDLVRKICEWKDACGGKYTVDTETVVGSDYVSLDIKGVDEVRANDVMDLVAQDPHIARYSCNFTKQTLSFVLETNRRKAPNAPVVPTAGPCAVRTDSKDSGELENELKAVRPHAAVETEEDLIMVCKCVVAVRRSFSVLNVISEQVKFDYTSTPGLIRVSVHGLAKVDKTLFAIFKKLSDEFDAEVVLIMSPRSERSVQISLAKAKATVNI